MKITVLDSHPDEESFCSALAERYATSAETAGHEVRRLVLREMEFDPILHAGYRQSQKLEPDLIRAQESITWCEHLMIVHPVWWGSMPALLKGFFDRTFLPGWAFKYHENGVFWDRLLSGRSARLIVTSDAPSLYNRIVHRNAPIRATRNMILKFSGFNPVKLMAIGSVRSLTESRRADYLTKAGELGAAAD